MGRIGLLGRIMLIVMAALFATIVSVLVIRREERVALPTRFLTPYPRLEQAAGVIDLVRNADPALRPDILRATNGLQLRAEILDAAPPVPDELQRAPRIEDTLRRLVSSSAQQGDIQAYTDPEGRRRAPGPRATEGRPARIVWRMPDGHVLVLTEPQGPSRVSLSFLGLPPGIWIGILGLAVGGLALLTAQREIRPLQRLTARAASFDGSPPHAPVEARGAPDIQRLANAIHDMQARVASLLQERSFLIGAISHDLKTYLTRLRLRAEAVPPGEARERMVADVEAMTSLIETALAFARGTAVSHRRDRIDLADLAAIEAAERTAMGQPVVMTDEAGPEAAVAGDPVALRRVVANLVDNACKFGRSRVELHIDRTPRHCRLRVDDDGPGISATERTAIFSPFYRIEGSRSRQTGGTGLGLAIARQIVEAHGGSLEVTDGSLGGACFTVTLPRLQVT